MSRTASRPIFLAIKSASQLLALFPEAFGVIGTSQQSPLASVGHLWPQNNRNVFKMAVMILAGMDP